MKLRLALVTLISLWAANAEAGRIGGDGHRCILRTGCAGGHWRSYYAAPIYPFGWYGMYGQMGGMGASQGPVVVVNNVIGEGSAEPARESAPPHEIEPLEIKIAPAPAPAAPAAPAPAKPAP